MRERVAPLPFFVAAHSLAAHGMKAYLRGTSERHDLRRQFLPVNPSRERMFNVPAVVLTLVAVLAIVHALLVFVFTPQDTDEFILTFAFIPARYGASLPFGEPLPGGFGAEIWTFVTYAFIHADISHLAFNCIWLLAFGSALARRFGARRFLVFSALTAAAGAATHLIFHFGAPAPVIGASAAISGAMGAATRFAFQNGGPISAFRTGDEQAYFVPAEPLGQSLRNPTVIAFLLVWFGTNLLFGLGSLPLPGAEQAVAWEAHIGGLLTGLLTFPLFDPVPRLRPDALPPNDLPSADAAPPAPSDRAPE
jgi:membrane associated rhomboid family serine protease